MTYCPYLLMKIAADMNIKYDEHLKLFQETYHEYMRMSRQHAESVPEYFQLESDRQISAYDQQMQKLQREETREICLDEFNATQKNIRVGKAVKEFLKRDRPHYARILSSMEMAKIDIYANHDLLLN